MRYYKIDIGDGALVYSSLGPDGRTIPGALNVEFDIPVAPFATPVGGAIARVWGIPLEQIAQAKDLNSKPIKIYGGMAKGLPLANPATAGLLAAGTVFPAFGNWIGTDMTLDLILAPPFGSPGQPANVVHNWPKGQPLSQAIKQALTTAFPGYPVNVAISDKLVLQRDDTSYYQSIEQYSQYIKPLSTSIVGSNDYAGVSISFDGTAINVYDGSQAGSSPTRVKFEDLIGQPTWIGLNEIQFKTAMRADLAVGKQITMPQGTLVTTTAGSASQFRQRSAFQGHFLVTMVRHVGNYRQPDAYSWNTTINAATAGTPGS
jgi:hypothetical protein